MTKKLPVIALLFSASLNVGTLTGYLYHQIRAADFTVGHEPDLAGLTEDERIALFDLRAAVFADVTNLRKASAGQNARFRQILATRPADDPEIAMALVRISDERARIQRAAITRIIAFRDTLSPRSRQWFRDGMEQPGFLLALFGLSGWGLPAPAAR